MGCEIAKFNNAKNVGGTNRTLTFTEIEYYITEYGINCVM